MYNVAIYVHAQECFYRSCIMSYSCLFVMLLLVLPVTVQAGHNDDVIIDENGIMLPTYADLNEMINTGRYKSDKSQKTDILKRVDGHLVNPKENNISTLVACQYSSCALADAHKRDMQMQ